VLVGRSKYWDIQNLKLVEDRLKYWDIQNLKLVEDRLKYWDNLTLKLVGTLKCLGIPIDVLMVDN